MIYYQVLISTKKPPKISSDMASQAVSANKQLKAFFDALPERSPLNEIAIRFCTMHSGLSCLFKKRPNSFSVSNLDRYINEALSPEAKRVLHLCSMAFSRVNSDSFSRNVLPEAMAGILGVKTRFIPSKGSRFHVTATNGKYLIVDEPEIKKLCASQGISQHADDLSAFFNARDWNATVVESGYAFCLWEAALNNLLRIVSGKSTFSQVLDAFCNTKDILESIKSGTLLSFL